MGILDYKHRNSLEIRLYQLSYLPLPPFPRSTGRRSGINRGWNVSPACPSYAYFFKRLIYLRVGNRKYRESGRGTWGSFINCLTAAATKTEPGQSQELVSHMEAANHLGQLLFFYPGREWGAGPEVEQLRHKLKLIWEAGIAAGSFAHYITLFLMRKGSVFLAINNSFFCFTLYSRSFPMAILLHTYILLDKALSVLMFHYQGLSSVHTISAHKWLSGATRHWTIG